MAFEQFPYTNFHDLNLDYLLKEVKEVKDNIDTTAENAQIATEQAAIATAAAASIASAPDKYIFIGDSYNNNADRVAWSDVLVSYLSIPADKYRSYYQDGSGFVGNTATTFETLLRNAYTFETDPTKIKAVVVAGGCNDILNSITVTALENAIASFVNTAKGFFPNAKIYVGCCGRYMNDYDAVVLNKVAPTYKLCTKYGAEYMANVEYAMNLSSYFNTDYTHPLPNGSRSIALAMAETLLGGTYSCQETSKDIGAVQTSNWTGSSDVHLKQTVDNNVIITSGQITVTGSLSMNNYTTYDVFQIFNNYDRAKGWDIPIPVQCELINTSNTSYRGACFLYSFYINDGVNVGIRFKLMPICLTTSGTIKTVKIYM